MTSSKPYRSVIKAVTWRFIGSLDTMIVSWFVTGNLKLAASIGGVEVITKMVLYFLHERAWARINIGMN